MCGQAYNVLLTLEPTVVAAVFHPNKVLLPAAPPESSAPDGHKPALGGKVLLAAIDRAVALSPLFTRFINDFEFNRLKNATSLPGTTTTAGPCRMWMEIDRGSDCEHTRWFQWLERSRDIASVLSAYGSLCRRQKHWLALHC